MNGLSGLQKINLDIAGMYVIKLIEAEQESEYKNKRNNKKHMGDAQKWL